MRKILIICLTFLLIFTNIIGIGNVKASENSILDKEYLIFSHLAYVKYGTEDIGKTIGELYIENSNKDFQSTIKEIENLGLEIDSVKAWRMFGFKDDVSSFQGVAFQNRDTKQIVIAFRGSQELKDWVFDSSIAIDSNILDKLIIVKSQVPAARVFVEEIVNKAKNDGQTNPSISLTGHSLGGWLAQKITLDIEEDQMNTPDFKNQILFGGALSFNGPGFINRVKPPIDLSTNTIKDLLGDDDRDYITPGQMLKFSTYPVRNLIIWPDGIGLFGLHLGDTDILPPSGLNSHTIKNFYDTLSVNLKPVVGGTVNEETFGYPVDGAIVKLLNQAGDVLDTAKTDENGRYTFSNLTPNWAYTLEIASEGYKIKKLDFLTTSNEIFVEKNIPIAAIDPSSVYLKEAEYFLQKLFRYDLALQLIDASINAKKTAENLLLKGEILFNLALEEGKGSAKYEESISAINESLSLKETVAGYTLQGDVFFAIGNCVDARTAYEKVNAMDPDNFDVLVRIKEIDFGLCANPVETEPGDYWFEHYSLKRNTNQAELMVRTGDIDNLGFGWPANFTPFSGASTPIHSFPWSYSDSEEPEGTDRIMVLSSYSGQPPNGRDGYTSTSSRPENSVKPITLNYDLQNTVVRSAQLQMFVDDFQAPVWGANYQVYLNERRAPFLERIINSLVQTGPIGKLINVQIPPEYLDIVQSGNVSILIDDKETGAGDGYAIDFAKLLINPRDYSQRGTVLGKVTDTAGQPVAGANVYVSGLATGKTDSEGNYKFENVPSGLVIVRVSKDGFVSQTQDRDLTSTSNLAMNFILAKRPNVITDAKVAENGDIQLGENTLSNFPANGRLVVDISSDDQTNNVSAQLTSDVVKVLKSKNAVYSLVRNDISFDMPITNIVQVQETVIQSTRLKSLSSSVSSIYDLNVNQGTEKVEFFPEPVNLTFTVDSAKVKNPSHVNVFYLDEKNNKWINLGGDYQDGTVSIETDHFSTYGVFESEEPSLKLPNPHDTTAPAAPKVDEITEHAISVTGLAEAGSTVQIKADGSEIGSGVAWNDGSFRVRIPKQPSGEEIMVTATDGVGNVSEATTLVVKDITAPGAPKVNSLSDKDIAVVGTAEAKSAISVKVGNAVIGTGAADINGKFTVKIPKQKAGTKVIVIAKDLAGNQGSVTVIVQDKTAPAAPKVNPLSDKDTVIAGTAEANSTVSVKLGAKLITSGAVNSVGKFSIKITKQKAGTKITVTAKDKSKNESAASNVTVLDKTAPIAPKVSSISDKSTSVTGTTESYATVFVKAGNKVLGTKTADKLGKFSIKIKKQKAGIKILVLAKDRTGNLSSAKTVTVLDKTAPAIPSVKKVTSKTKTVTGKAEKSATIYIYNGKKEIGKGTVDQKGYYKVKIKIQKKGSKLRIYAQDKAGNKSKSKYAKVY